MLPTKSVHKTSQVCRMDFRLTDLSHYNLWVLVGEPGAGAADSRRPVASTGCLDRRRWAGTFAGSNHAAREPGRVIGGSYCTPSLIRLLKAIDAPRTTGLAVAAFVELGTRS